MQTDIAEIVHLLNRRIDALSGPDDWGRPDTSELGTLRRKIDMQRLMIADINDHIRRLEKDIKKAKDDLKKAEQDLEKFKEEKLELEGQREPPRTKVIDLTRSDP